MQRLAEKGMSVSGKFSQASLFLFLFFWASVGLAGKMQPDLLSKAKAAGSIRVLVMLNEDPVAGSAVKTKAQRQTNVRRNVTSVLSRLQRKNIKLYHRFSLVSAFAIEADTAMLQRLQNDPAVRRIDMDEPGTGAALAPDESSILNNVSPLQGLGLDGAGMKVAVIDSGLDTHHVDLMPSLIGQQCFCSGGCCPNGKSTQSGFGAAEDGHGHGTNVTGIILGQGNVSPRGAVPAAELVAVKVLDDNNSFCCTSDLVAAMDWVAVHHPDVDAVNVSVGTDGLYSNHCDTSTAATQAMAAAINNLVALGAVVTSSSGNQGNSNKMSAPACVRNAVSVGATWDFTGGAKSFLGCVETSTSPKQPTCFSNRSVTTDLYGAGALVESTGLEGATSTFGGTSMASPMAAACAIALKQAVPFSTVAQRIEAMTLSPTTVTDTASGVSFPFLDCVDALKLLTEDTAPVLTLADATVIEGHYGIRLASFTASLSKPAQAGGVSFQLATSPTVSMGNAAVAGQDYVAVALTNLTIPAGQTTAVFTVKVMGDRKVEPDEIFWVTVGNVSGANVTKLRAVGRITTDDESPLY